LKRVGKARHDVGDCMMVLDACTFASGIGSENEKWLRGVRKIDQAVV